jgi:hypothetical protein
VIAISLTLLVGTSGDTGSAAIAAAVRARSCDMIVLYPAPGYSSITPVQVHNNLFSLMLFCFFASSLSFPAIVAYLLTL